VIYVYFKQVKYMGITTRTFANNIKTSGCFDDTKLTGNLPTSNVDNTSVTCVTAIPGMPGFLNQSPTNVLITGFCSLASDPSPLSVGQIWYNTTTNTLCAAVCCNYSYWTSQPAMNVGRSVAGTGTNTAALAFGGRIVNPTAATCTVLKPVTAAFHAATAEALPALTVPALAAVAKARVSLPSPVIDPPVPIAVVPSIKFTVLEPVPTLIALAVAPTVTVSEPVPPVKLTNVPIVTELATVIFAALDADATLVAAEVFMEVNVVIADKSPNVTPPVPVTTMLVNAE
jgi:hypothetical protein